jgi:hypothetical protein
MKKFIYITSLIIAISSCKSVEKMVEQGKYDEAISFSTKKLQGKKNKKTKYVKGLERALEKVNAADLRRIEFLTSNPKAENWDKVYDAYDNIRKRQECIYPLLPLISEDGYQAEFLFVKVDKKMIEAGNKASEYYYQRGISYLEEARSGDKMAARYAVSALEKIERYQYEYKNKNELLDEAYSRGTTRIKVSMENMSDVFIPKRFEEEVLSLSVRDLNDRWTEYYTAAPNSLPIDVVAKLYVDALEISPERETIRQFVESTEVVNGSRVARDQYGNNLVDTLGNFIYEDNIITVQAFITEIFREKEAIVIGQIEMKNVKTSEKIYSRAIKVNASFDDYACNFTGDQRAISGNTKARVKPYPAPFPSDYDMTMIVAEDLKYEMKKTLKKSIY